MKRKNLIGAVAVVAFFWIVTNHYDFKYSCVERGTTIYSCDRSSSIPNGIERDFRERKRPDYVPDVLVLLGAGLLIWYLNRKEV